MGRLTRNLLVFGSMLLTSAPAHAGALDSLLSAHADSMGLNREWVDERCWHLVEEISGLGLTGTAETWAQALAFVSDKMIEAQRVAAA